MPTVKNYQKSVDKQKQAYDYFISQGYSPEASSGIVGNLVHESGLNTSIEGDKGYSGGSSFGLAQWRGARLKNLKQKYGDKWTDFGNQLEYVKYELENTHQKANEALKNTRDVFQAGQAFSDLYEIPAKKYGQNKDRQSKVNNVYNLFSGQPITEDFTDYVVPEKINSFAEAAPTQLESLPEEPKIDSKAAEEIKTQTNEYNFLKDLEAFKSKPVTANTVPLEQVQQLAPTNYLEKYNEISNFVVSPLMQQGGVATRADSLAVYNNSKIVENFYKKAGYIKTGGEDNKGGNLKAIDIGAKEYNEKDVDLIINNKLIKDQFYRKNQYKKNVDNNRFFQRETANAILNPSSPMQLVDRRIEPRNTVEYFDAETKDLVKIATYNNIANKPYDLLTSKEKIEREKIYGKTGIPSQKSKLHSEPIPTKKSNQEHIFDITPYVNSLQLKPSQTTINAEFSTNLIPTSTISEIKTYGVDRFQNQYRAKGQSRPHTGRDNEKNWDEDVYITYLKDPTTLGVSRQNNYGYNVYNETYKNLVEGQDFIYGKYEEGGTIPTSINGMYEFPNQTVKVPTKDGRITMKNIPHPILGVDELGNHKLMLPNKEYKFAGKTVMEYPVPNLKNFFS